jgi:hypothetical protein
MAIYPGGERVDHAQQVLDRHAVSSGDGLCLTCRHPGPCEHYEKAVQVFATSLRLPRRTPGATRPELINARRLDRPNLFVAKVSAT